MLIISSIGYFEHNYKTKIELEVNKYFVVHSPSKQIAMSTKDLKIKIKCNVRTRIYIIYSYCFSSPPITLSILQGTKQLQGFEEEKDRQTRVYVCTYVCICIYSLLQIPKIHTGKHTAMQGSPIRLMRNEEIIIIIK